MRNDQFKKIVETTDYTGKFRTYTNKNKMLRLYEWANGVKTGYTLKAGRCLVSSAVRNGMDIVCVVLNCPDMYERSCAIFDNCFNKYCKLKENKSIIVESNKTIDYKVSPYKKITDNAVGELKVYSENSLIFNEKLYSI